MSILIKGLNMPKGEHKRVTVQIGSDGDVYLVTDFELKAEVYKFNAVEIPKPHGRLIDADFMKELGAKCIAKRCDDGVLLALGRIDDLPTVIEAEEQK